MLCLKVSSHWQARLGMKIARNNRQLCHWKFSIARCCVPMLTCVKMILINNVATKEARNRIWTNDLVSCNHLLYHWAIRAKVSPFHLQRKESNMNSQVRTLVQIKFNHPTVTPTGRIQAQLNNIQVKCYVWVWCLFITGLIVGVRHTGVCMKEQPPWQKSHHPF